MRGITLCGGFFERTLGRCVGEGLIHAMRRCITHHTLNLLACMSRSPAIARPTVSVRSGSNAVERGGGGSPQGVVFHCKGALDQKSVCRGGTGDPAHCVLPVPPPLHMVFLSPPNCKKVNAAIDHILEGCLLCLPQPSNTVSPTGTSRERCAQQHGASNTSVTACPMRNVGATVPKTGGGRITPQEKTIQSERERKRKRMLCSVVEPFLYRCSPEADSVPWNLGADGKTCLETLLSWGVWLGRHACYRVTQAS